MSNECGFTCLACGQFRPGPEGAHSEAACLRVQLAAANERAGRLERDYQKARAAFLRLRNQPRQSTLDVVCDLNDLNEYFEGGA